MKDVPGWEVSDISKGTMTQRTRVLITLFAVAVAAPWYGFVRWDCDRLEKASTTTHGIGLRSRSWLYDGSRFALYHNPRVVEQLELGC